MHKVDISKIVMAGMEAQAKILGLKSLPETIRDANPDVFSCFTAEVQAFVILFADRYEKSDNVVFFDVYTEWLEMTDSTLARRTLYNTIYKYFYRHILGNCKADCMLERTRGCIPLGTRAANVRLAESA